MPTRASRGHPRGRLGAPTRNNGRVPKIIGASLADHREEVRRRLHTALAGLMEERGFDAISLADIAQAAGIGRTALYNHVTDKEALLLDYLADESERYVAALETALADADDPVDQLRLYVRHRLRMRRSLHMPAGLRTAVSPETQARLREHAAPVEAVLRRILTTGIASGAFAQQPVDVAIPLVNACLTARLGQGGADREASATEAFVLRAVGAAV